MKSITEIDKNFKVETKLDKKDICFFNSLEPIFQIYGVFYEDGKFRRLPERVAKDVNEGVLALHANTAGGRVRFVTDSPYVAIHAKYGEVGRFDHFPLTGTAGFDLYEEINGEEVYVMTFRPPYDVKDIFESVIDFSAPRTRTVTINMPLYSEVAELYIGVAEGSELSPAMPYADRKPFVYYGSSITQGGCASRPGNAYQSFIQRRFHTDYINLGFSGCATAEKTISDYINNLDMSVFIYDYDNNAPSVEHLEKTHERMFREIRGNHPDLPIILMSMPNRYYEQWQYDRMAVIEKTYNNAIAAADKNVYFIPGYDLVKYVGNNGTVDNCHPNDLGFYSMARVLGDLIEEILKK